jgi:thioredoxin reductase (NADPH)
VQKVIDFAGSGKIKLITEAEVTGINGDGNLTNVVVTHQKDGEIIVETDHFIPLFGLKPSLGPIADWGFEIEKNAIKVNTLDYSTNIPGIYAIGDVNTYQNKLKLILCGFHEGTMAVQSAFARIHPDKKNILKYTTVNGVTGF